MVYLLLSFLVFSDTFYPTIQHNICDPRCRNSVCTIDVSKDDTKLSGWITSPGYPHEFLFDHHGGACHLDIIAADYSKIQITLHDFWLTNATKYGYCRDFFEINWSTLNLYSLTLFSACGKLETPRSLNYPLNQLQLLYHARNATSMRGFNISYEVFGCPMSKLPKVVHGYLNQTDELAVLICDRGFKFKEGSGSGYYYCDHARRKWTVGGQKLGVCEAEHEDWTKNYGNGTHCVPLRWPKNGRIYEYDYMSDGKAFYICDYFTFTKRYILHGPNERTCKNDSDRNLLYWTGTTPVCVEDTCDPIRNTIPITSMLRLKNTTVSYATSIGIFHCLHPNDYSIPLNYTVVVSCASNISESQLPICVKNAALVMPIDFDGVPHSDSPSNSRMSGVAIGVTITIVCLLLLVVVLAYYYIRFHRASNGGGEIGGQIFFQSRETLLDDTDDHVLRSDAIYGETTVPVSSGGAKKA